MLANAMIAAATAGDYSTGYNIDGYNIDIP